MLNVSTSTPNGLLAKIKSAIDHRHVVTWSYDKDGDFTRTPTQWSQKAWLRPRIGPGGLTFTLISNHQVPLTTEVYGVYHGRFVEMLLAHFSKDFSSASAITN